MIETILNIMLLIVSFIYEAITSIFSGIMDHWGSISALIIIVILNAISKELFEIRKRLDKNAEQSILDEELRTIRIAVEEICANQEAENDD